MLQSGGGPENRGIQVRRCVMVRDDEQIDVLIAGGGFAGLTLAIALAQSLGQAISVTVADPALGKTYAGDERASAIVAAVRRLFETLGVWPSVAADAQPILDMVVTDSRIDDAVRPVFLTFGGEIEPGEPFAHMIENRHLVAALETKAREVGVTLRPAAVIDFTPPPVDACTVPVRLADGGALSPRVVVAADGARSSVRERAGIPVHGWEYGQSAIVTNVAHERDHEGRAIEHFLPAGPFAILPLTGKRSSIVWTETTSEADRIVALPDEAFHDELERRFKLHLGEITTLGGRRAHRLGFFVARTFIAERLALVGDAAHLIHPIAGQGLNMGLRDVAALAEVLVDAVRLGLDPGEHAVLERYQRWRRFDTVAMGFATDALNRLFSNRSTALRVARDFGLGLVDRLPDLKRLFIREAAGLVGDVPKLLRGKAL
jgi:2-octaprenyl-6-methoxyphenol hydroxylase